MMGIHVRCIYNNVSNFRYTPLGIPHTRGKMIFNIGEGLLRSASHDSRMSIERTKAGWNIIGAIMTLGSSVVKGSDLKYAIDWNQWKLFRIINGINNLIVLFPQLVVNKNHLLQCLENNNDSLFDSSCHSDCMERLYLVQGGFPFHAFPTLDIFHANRKPGKENR